MTAVALVIAHNVPDWHLRMKLSVTCRNLAKIIQEMRGYFNKLPNRQQICQTQGLHGWMDSHIGYKRSHDHNALSNPKELDKIADNYACCFQLAKTKAELYIKAHGTSDIGSLFESPYFCEFTFELYEQFNIEPCYVHDYVDLTTLQRTFNKEKKISLWFNNPITLIRKFNDNMKIMEYIHKCMTITKPTHVETYKMVIRNINDKLPIGKLPSMNIEHFIDNMDNAIKNDDICLIKNTYAISAPFMPINDYMFILMIKHQAINCMQYFAAYKTVKLSIKHVSNIIYRLDDPIKPELLDIIRSYISEMKLRTVICMQRDCCQHRNESCSGGCSRLALLAMTFIRKKYAQLYRYHFNLASTYMRYCLRNYPVKSKSGGKLLSQEETTELYNCLMP